MSLSRSVCAASSIAWIYFAREDVYELLGKPRQLRFDRDRLTFPVGPG